MRKTILCAAAAVAVVMLFAGPLAAQTAPDPAKVRAEVDKAIETMRKDARAAKSDILGKTMSSTARRRRPSGRSTSSTRPSCRP